MIKIYDDEATAPGIGVRKLDHVEINGQVFAKEMVFGEEPSAEHETLVLALTFQSMIMDIKMAVESAYGDTPAVGTEDNPAYRSMSNAKRSKKVDVPTESWQKDVERRLTALESNKPDNSNIIASVDEMVSLLSKDGMPSARMHIDHLLEIKERLEKK